MQDSNVLIKQLLEAGVHFGHRTNRWNPKMARFIFGEKNGIYIIDLQKTVESINEACQFLSEIVSKGKTVLFVGTKKQAQGVIKEQAERSGMFYVSERWLGGTLTNFKTIRQSIKRLEELENLKNGSTFELLSKKERAQITKELEKLIRNLGGIRKMGRLPGTLFVIDSKKEEIAVNEARKLSIPVIALIDTNSDPDKIDYPIPGNDDAIKAVELVIKVIAESVYQNRQRFLESRPQEEKAAAEESAEVKKDEGKTGYMPGDKRTESKAKEEHSRKKPQRQRRGRPPAQNKQKE